MNNTFGDDIKDFIDIAKELKEKNEVIKFNPKKSTLKIDKSVLHQKANDLDFNIHSKDPKSKKVKFKNFAKYILTELAQFDNEFEEVNFEITAQESLNEGDDDIIEGLESRLISIEGSVDALFQMGRYFGLSSEMMQHYIPNINAEYQEVIKDSDKNLKSIMKA